MQIKETKLSSGVDTGNLSGWSGKASGEDIPEQAPKEVREAVWEQSLGAEGAAVLCSGPSGESKGPVSSGGASEGTVVRDEVPGEGAEGGAERAADCTGHRKDFGFYSI